MRLPFTTEQQLLDRFALLSEAVRIDYYRRVEQASVAALAAHLEKDLAARIESQESAARAQAKRVNLAVVTFLVALAAVTLIADLPYGRVAAWFVAGAWVAYLGATEFLLLPQIRLQQANHWNLYQVRAREWTALLGNQGFAAHMTVVGAEYQGDAPDDADAVHLAIRGFALVQAERATLR